MQSTSGVFLSVARPLGLVVTVLFATATHAQVLFVANAGNNSVSEITSSGVASTFATGLNNAHGVAFDSRGNLYVADYISSGTISEITPSGVVSTFATGLSYPDGLAFDSSGNLYNCTDGVRA